MASVIATCDHSVPRTTSNIAPPTADRRMRGKPIDTRPVPATAKASQAHPRHWASHCCRCATLSDVLPWPQGVKVSSHVETMRKTASNNTRQTSLRTEGGAVPARDRCNGSCFTCLKDGLLHPAEPRDAGWAFSRPRAAKIRGPPGRLGRAFGALHGAENLQAEAEEHTSE